MRGKVAGCAGGVIEPVILDVCFGLYRLVVAGSGWGDDHQMTDAPGVTPPSVKLLDIL